MKIKIITIVIMLLASNISFAKSSYKTAMKKNLKAWEKAETSHDIIAIANTFSLIAKAEKNEWLPYYYHAQCYIVLSFEAQDPEAKDAFLDEAESSFDAMLSIAPDESEIHALKGLFNTARLTVDPMNRGQQYIALSMKNVAHALELNPENPRAKYMLIANEMGTANFFGKDVSQYCAQAEKVLLAWDDYKIKTDIHPNWGKSELEQIMKDCK